MDWLIKVKNVSFGYAKGFCLNNIDFTVSSGEFILFRGENGSGKTTIIRGLLGLVPCLSGKVHMNIALRDISYVPQESTLNQESPATSMDIVKSTLPFQWKDISDTAMKALTQMGMKDFANKRFNQLSGGQKRRVLFARVLCTDPKLIILDEPTANVDNETEKQIESILLELSTVKDMGIIATSHVSNWAEKARCLKVEGGTIHE
ncbi:MAG: Manganese transport system ATP-binding protein mntB [Candidatus Magnetoglobus multicellularis str. Araruama]|uniref:Manganese transport system ATP-binding protein mntB n=1 Tax=Candidatus Magnetoglobus multicellularis str. Araruama TaxID=890399 RepID=A0A1V1P836_9BACT|nr:MAG: Manganese transport system ATP-binding protein mntB [Candidatus Magnetoglobus multicellularis str. Araruama]